ncbi:pyridoxamine 5'-phosphate oxidase family protein [Kineosporia succinea]|uniref:Nitroimidazol reductase NimA-like FMN-containing flavoprotein (Pyridoxamine 5'-phosphate oxidase superfamily) n=1 Tax=Kineosporia succinea TaxID=84632 RepID=A0ABT9PCB3_9ACTN|nr:pyridoxamine 5'-phosphate oxidase family protein [Kineosporia succinea]MDP9830349.1 nitroimidazol reductase NimA-like FMN-containing flavoprotein (pyridoxamine 5'-phosphate oxidase superfamily) [Kineosporia succinea]
MTTHTAPGHLSVSACWQHLRTTDIGRLAVLVEGDVDIFPVNYTVDHGCIIVRTAGGTKLSWALAGPPVAFETDGHDSDERRFWSVVLKGRAEELTDLDERLSAGDLPLMPRHGGPKHRFLRIVPGTVTGRRFESAQHEHWHDPLAEARGRTVR